MNELATVDDPDTIADVFERDRAVHLYGLADLDEPYWSSGRWWRAGEAVVGALHLPEAPNPVVYAVSARAADATLDLLERLVGELPDRFVITGPTGLRDRLGPWYEPAWSARYTKMHLPTLALVPPVDRRVRPLGREHWHALVDLYDADPDAGDFFWPHLLDTGHYVGVLARDRVIAAAGIHVLSRRRGVAAIGNVATHPDQRRQGLARAVMATLVRRLAVEVPTIGLNVRADRPGPRALYEGLGFETLVPYDEAELTRRGG